MGVELELPTAAAPVLAYQAPTSRQFFWRTTLAHAFGAFCGAGVFTIPMALTTADMIKFFAGTGISPRTTIIQAVVMCVAAHVFVTMVAGIEFSSLLKWAITRRQATIWRHAWIPALITGVLGFPGFWLMISFDSWPALLVLLVGAGWVVAMEACGFWFCLQWPSAALQTSPESLEVEV